MYRDREKTAVSQDTSQTAVGQDTSQTAVSQETSQTAVSQDTSQTAVSQDTSQTAVSKIEGKETRRIRRKQLVDDLKKTRKYWNLKDEALSHIRWRTRFGRGCGPVVRKTAG